MKREEESAQIKIMIFCNRISHKLGVKVCSVLFPHEKIIIPTLKNGKDMNNEIEL
jgi:hypothetical protein